MRDGLHPDERKIIVENISSRLTYPYLKAKVWELNALYGRYNVPVYELPESAGGSVLPSILSAHKGKFVQMVCLSSPRSDAKFCSSLSVENLLIDFNQSQDLQILFVFNGNEYSEEEYNAFVLRHFPENSCCLRLDVEDYIGLQALFRFTESRKQITFDRNGCAFSAPFNMDAESSFRQRLRNLLKNESHTYVQ